MSCYTFGLFSLDAEARILLREGEPVPLAGKTFDTLLVLVQNRGRLMDKDELLAKVWPGTVVEEANLSQSIFTLRKILGDNPKDHHYVATVAGRGYQFVAPVTEVKNGRAPVKLHPFWRRSHMIQSGAVVIAAALAAVTWIILRRAPSPPPELTQQRLTFNSSENGVQSAAISPDGNYLAYSDNAGIHVKLLSTGDERLIPTPAGVPAGTLSYVDSWFPDGTQLLVHSRQPDEHDSMRTVSVMGQSPRELRRDTLGWSVSPDGARIAFSPNEQFDFFREIWLMDSQGENAHKILGLGQNEWLQSVHWSSDGQRLAYIRTRHFPDKYLQSIETCDLNGADRKVAMVVRDGRVQDIAWLSDGRIIYSQLGIGSIDADLWQIFVDPRRGRASGKEKRLTRWAGSNLLGLSASANGKRIAVRKVTSHGQVLLGEIAPGGMQSRPPRRLTQDEANDFASTWTADSRAVIVISNRDSTPHLFRQPIGGGQAEPLVTGAKEVVYLARLSPDGTWVLYIEISWPGTRKVVPSYRLMRAPVNGGAPQFVLEMRRWRDFQCSRAPASLCVILEESEDTKRLELTAFDPLKGRGKLLRTTEFVALMDGSGISPDGSTFAIAVGGQADTHIRLFSLSGGSDHEIVVKGWPNIIGLDWAPDGKGFYCGSISPAGAALLFVSLSGTVQILWRDSGPGLIGIPSLDGRYLAITTQARNSNAWMVEGF